MNTSPDLQVLVLHGFTSSPKSEKAQFIKEQCARLPRVQCTLLDFNPTPKDFEYLTITGMINRLRQYLLDHPAKRVMLIGSSLGGLVATRYAHRFGGIHTMLLLAPALFYYHWGSTEEDIAHWKNIELAPIFHLGFQKELHLSYTFHQDGLNYTSPVPPAAKTIIIHGTQDATVPVTTSRDYAATYKERVNLVEIDADHRLTGHNECIWEHAYSLIQG